MKRLLLLLSFLFIGFLSIAQPSDFMVGDYIIDGDSSLFGIKVFERERVTINVGSQNHLREFTATSFPQVTGSTPQLITLDLSNGEIKLNTHDTNVSCANNPNVILDEASIGNNTTWSLANGDSMFSINYLENSTNTCGAPAVASIFSLIKIPDNSTYIPEDSFEQALINLGHDTILDNFVDTINIDALTTLNISNQNIMDFTGLEDFVSLENLDLSQNFTFGSVLDLSSLSSLKVLNASGNNMSEVLVSNTIEELNLGGNVIEENDYSDLTSLKILNLNGNNVSLTPVFNGMLEKLFLNGNSFPTIDLSAESSLVELTLDNNSNLNSINLTNSNNLILTSFSALNLPALQCALVSDLPYMQTNFSSDLSSGHSFTDDCNRPLQLSPDYFVFDINVVAGENFGFVLSSNTQVEIQWDDNSVVNFSNPNDLSINHTYSSPGIYTVAISGNLQSFRFTEFFSQSNLATIELTQWGTSNWEDMKAMFRGCENFTSLATDMPVLSNVTDLSEMFMNCSSFNSDLSNWDTSNITDMNSMFNGTSTFNQPLNSWDVSSVTDMASMFEGSTLFDQDLNNWNVSNVTDLSKMFKQAIDFNGNITTWDTSNVTDMKEMFYKDSFTSTGSFNQSIGNWDVSNVTDMSGLLRGRTTFNKSLNNWDVGLVTDMNNMFFNALSFNQPLNSWDVSSVVNMQNMFSLCSVFNQNINSWDVSSVVNMQNMFGNARDFNQSLNNWDVSNVTNMRSMFFSANNFNGNISNWNVSNVVNMGSMFENNYVFNQNLNNWDVSSCTIFGGMFHSASNYNQPLNNWNLSAAISLNSMFYRAISFNQPLNNWDVSNVRNFSGLFLEASSFNQPLNSWNVSNATQMSGVFQGSAFNHSLSNWDVSNVTNMSGMFKNTAFNQDLSNWDFNLIVSFTNGNPVEHSFVDNSNLDVTNFDLLLQNFVRLSLQNKMLVGTNLTYCDVFSKNILIQNGWTFTADALDPNCPDNVLQGRLVYDFDSNGCNPNDVPSVNSAIKISNTNATLVLYTDINGDYSTSLSDDTYSISPLIDYNLFTATPVNATITAANQSTITQDFCLTTTIPIDDLEITIMPLEEARPGFDTDYKLIYKNKGNTLLSGTIDFSYDDDYMDFLNASPAVSSSSVGNLIWSFSNLNPFESREIDFTLNMNTPTDPNFPLNSDDVLNFNASITPSTNDATPLDNIFDLDQTVVNSYDPNDKTCLQGKTVEPSMVGEYVHYRIRFENEGTVSAINVRIVDYIDTSVYDISTLQPLSSSHDYVAQITEDNKVEFIFDNINLPNIAPASQGYVLFKIKTVDTLAIGDTFSNQAGIYFDFNFPIITNLETTTVAVPLSINGATTMVMRLYPNPANEIVTITSNVLFESYEVYDLRGVLVDAKTLQQLDDQHKINVGELASGIYMIQINNSQGSITQKLIVE